MTAICVCRFVSRGYMITSNKMYKARYKTKETVFNANGTCLTSATFANKQSAFGKINKDYFKQIVSIGIRYSRVSKGNPKTVTRYEYDNHTCLKGLLYIYK